ncbi:MAG: FAD-dependent monooxygenase [Gemmatimonadetes bacterium]|nr:FAD-dependent monooxygenase [Gemmatimonadota bacterium]
MSEAAPRDVVVVGGGPAGSATAARLADAGHCVLLLDRAHFPRPKPCGECLNPAAVAALAALGVLGAVQAAGPARLRGWRIQPHDSLAFSGSFPDDVNGFALSRAVLDEILLDHARSRGVVVRMGEQVTDLLWSDGFVVGVRTRAEEIRARLVVGADGLRSIVVRKLNLLRRPPRLRKLALAAHVRGVGDLDEQGVMYVHEGGCVGVAAVGDGTANIVVVAEGEEAAHVAGNRNGYFDRTVRRYPALSAAERIEEVLATGPFDWPTRGAVADGALLVGDAAGYYDPFTGQGIFRALRGAELAAGTAGAALRHGDVSAAALAPYERARRRGFGPGERVQRLVEFFVARPDLLKAVAGRLARRPALADALIAVTGDLKPVRSLLSPRVLARWVF